MAGKFIYGVLKGTVTGHLRDADDDHYQILVNADGVMFRVAINVHSSKNPPDLRFQAISTLPVAVTKAMTDLAVGFTNLKSEPGGLAQDYVRGGLLKLGKFEIVPGDVLGTDNDLKDAMERAALDAIRQKGARVYAFGARWGPERTTKDKYFKFLPGNGVHNIHMNQGNDPSFAEDDGVFRDGCLFFEYPGGKYRAIFLAFQSQTFETDDETGHASRGAAAMNRLPAVQKNKPSGKTPGRKRTAKKATKKSMNAHKRSERPLGGTGHGD